MISEVKDTIDTFTNTPTSPYQCESMPRDLTYYSCMFVFPLVPGESWTIVVVPSQWGPLVVGFFRLSKASEMPLQ